MMEVGGFFGDSCGTVVFGVAGLVVRWRESVGRGLEPDKIRRGCEGR